MTGVFIRTWQPEWLPCTWKEERRDAMRVAARLDIPFVTLDLQEEYKRGVADYLIAEYKAGRTPNPDVMCNKEIKFGAFYEWAMEHGANYVATGHYAQIRNQKSDSSAVARPKGGTKVETRSQKDEDYSLEAGVDKNKDQSYFLWNIRTDQLPHILFPIGHLTKPEVRALARKFGLPTAEKKDSQGICFLGMVNMKEFLSHYIGTTRGDVLGEDGEVVGHHPGAALFTLGERHGFTITEKTPHDERYFVIAKDVEKNTIVVGHRTKIENLKLKINPAKGGIKNSPHRADDARISIGETNWIGEAPVIGKIYHARGRYRQVLEKIVFKEIDTVSRSAIVGFLEEAELLASGQSLVIYDGEVCVGGGVIS